MAKAPSARGHLQLLELAEVCGAADLTNAKQRQPAGHLISALNSAQQVLDGSGGLASTS